LAGQAASVTSARRMSAPACSRRLRPGSTCLAGRQLRHRKAPCRPWRWRSPRPLARVTSR